MLFRPLLDDLLAAESYAEVRGPLQRGESVLAIELNDQRAALWQTNWSNILAAWKLGKSTPLTVGEAKGWELKRKESPGSIQFVRAGNWVLIGLGQERLTLLPGLLEEIKKTGRPIASQPNVPLEFEADLPRLGDWLPSLASLKLPPVRYTLTGKGDYVRTELRLLYSDALPWKFEPWKIPTNFVSDPLISFTVARGIAPLLSEVKGIAGLGLDPLPNQFCAWGPATIHANTLLSIPIANPSNVLYQIGPKLPDFTSNLLSQSIGGFALISNRNELIWTGWPVLIPHLQARRDAGADYLLGGLFPLRLSTNKPPAELYAQIKDRPNLVYYDWEITQERLTHARQFQQLWDIMNYRQLVPTNATEQKWLHDIGPLLGNSITEVTLSSPKELTLVRRSDSGFTGFELASLARWLASPGFPWKLEPPPRQSSRGTNALKNASTIRSNMPAVGTNATTTRSNAPPSSLSKPPAPTPKKQ